MKELVKPIDSKNQQKELFAEAMCSENDCYHAGFPYSYNNSTGEEDDIFF